MPSSGIVVCNERIMRVQGVTNTPRLLLESLFLVVSTTEAGRRSAYGHLLPNQFQCGGVV